MQLSTILLISFSSSQLSRKVKVKLYLYCISNLYLLLQSHSICTSFFSYLYLLMQTDDLMSKQFLHFQSIFADNICEYIMCKFYLYSQYVIGDTISISICILFPICIC